MFNRNSGYVGNRMSIRANEAYENGEMPLSKWSKGSIIYGISECISNNDLQVDYSESDLEKLTKKELECFLRLSSWHHTGSCFRETHFYEIDEDAVESFSLEDITNILCSRLPRKKPEKKEKPANMFITALVQFENWEGSKRNLKKVRYEETIKYMSTDKLVRTSCGTKRLSNIVILEKIEQKTKFASPSRLKANKAN